MALPKKNLLEWAVFTLSLLMVGGVLGLLVYDAATREETPPRLEVQLGEPMAQPTGYAVPVTVVNNGGETAEGVQVEVLLEREGQEPEQGTFEIAYLPRNSSGDGWAVFQSDPRTGQLRGYVVGYELP